MEEANPRPAVLGWLDAEQDSETLHGFDYDLREMWKRHPSHQSEVRLLTTLYDRNQCSFCREHTVRRLIELDSLSVEMRAECAYDANDDLRELVKEPCDLSST